MFKKKKKKLTYHFIANTTCAAACLCVLLYYSEYSDGNKWSSGLPVLVKEQDQEKHVTQDDATGFSHRKGPGDSGNAVKIQKHQYQGAD